MNQRSTSLLALLLGGYAALLAFRPNRESDPFWHMGLAQRVLEQGRRVIPEPWSFVGIGQPRPVPEWGWGTLLLYAHQIAGWDGITLLVEGCAALTAVLLVIYLGRRTSSQSAVALVATTVVALLAARSKARPEVLAFALAAGTMILAENWRSSRRIPVGIGLLGLELLWAQIHGSFVLAPAIFLILGAQSYRIQADLGLLALLTLGLASSAWGLDLSAYLLSHANGDAVAHIQDMLPPTWDMFNPIGHLYGPLWVLLLGLGLAGMLYERRWYLREGALALLGVALLSEAVRFVAFAGLLAAPLALRGAEALLNRDLRRGLAVAGTLALALSAASSIDSRSGPLGKGGLATDAFPIAGAARLAQEPGPLRVLSTFSAGAPIGFWSQGQILTGVDSRTPLHFDDTDYALSRDVLRDLSSVRRAVARYEAGALLIERSSPACADLADTWVPVAVDPLYTTFLPSGASPVAGLAPCGADYLTTDACSGLPSTLSALRAVADTEFLDYLQAEWAFRCAQKILPLPEAGPNTAWGPARDRLAARQLLVQGDGNAAVNLLAPRVAAGDLLALSILGPALFGPPVHPRARELMEALTLTLDDTTPADVRADLAWICMQQQDSACARFQAFRAAAAGSRRVAEVLIWLAEQDPSPTVREDAGGWLRSLNPSPP